MSLETSDTLELQDRAKTLIEKYADMSLKLADSLSQFGRLRKELQIIVDELKKRGAEIKLDDNWVQETTNKVEGYRKSSQTDSESL